MGVRRTHWSFRVSAREQDFVIDRQEYVIIVTRPVDGSSNGHLKYKNANQRVSHVFKDMRQERLDVRDVTGVDNIKGTLLTRIKPYCAEAATLEVVDRLIKTAGTGVKSTHYRTERPLTDEPTLCFGTFTARDLHHQQPFVYQTAAEDWDDAPCNILEGNDGSNGLCSGNFRGGGSDSDVRLTRVCRTSPLHATQEDAVEDFFSSLADEPISLKATDARDILCNILQNIIDATLYGFPVSKATVHRHLVAMAFKSRNDVTSCPHVLLHGPSGCGKTLLGNLLFPSAASRIVSKDLVSADRFEMDESETVVKWDDVGGERFRSNSDWDALCSMSQQQWPGRHQPVILFCSTNLANFRQSLEDVAAFDNRFLVIRMENCCSLVTPTMEFDIFPESERNRFILDELEQISPGNDGEVSDYLRIARERWENSKARNKRPPPSGYLHGEPSTSRPRCEDLKPQLFKPQDSPNPAH